MGDLVLQGNSTLTILVFDTETTGKANPKSPPDDPSQPDIVQLAAILVDDAMNEVASLNVIVDPAYWTIPEDASRIHGIGQDKAERFGVGLSSALLMFCEMADRADHFVAHNIDFDVLVVRRALARLRETKRGRGFADMMALNADPFEGKECRCTMLAAKPILKLPNRNPNINDPLKFPRLEECYKHFFNETLEGAHDALVDVRATFRVYLSLCEYYGMKP